MGLYIIDRDYNSALKRLRAGETVVYNKSCQTLRKELAEYKAFKCLDFQEVLKLQSSI